MTKRNYPSAGQGILAGTEVERHPMWSVPTKRSDVSEFEWVEELRAEIRRRLTPFDGRPNSDEVILYCTMVYTATTEAYSAWGSHAVAGLINLDAARRARILRQHSRRDMSLADRRAAAKAIEALAHHFTEAIERSL